MSTGEVLWRCLPLLLLAVYHTAAMFFGPATGREHTATRVTVALVGVMVILAVTL